MNAPEEITHVRASRSDMVVFILLVRTVNGGDNRGMIKRKDIWRVEMERMSKSKNKSTYVEYNDWICTRKYLLAMNQKLLIFSYV